MKRNLTFALLASAAVLMLGTVTPSQAQQNTMRGHAATSERGYQPAAVRYRAQGQFVREDAQGAFGLGAYAYVPGSGAGLSPYSCAIEGTYGRSVDYANCY